MDNPLEQPAPDDNLERVHEFARDLAYGVAQGWWPASFFWHAEIAIINHPTGKTRNEFEKHLSSKWRDKLPDHSLLVAFGYAVRTSSKEVQYALAEKAFSLLERPSIAPGVFICYRREESSPLALLVEARLKLAGNSNVFLDKNIVPGDEWHGQLEERIKGSRYFVCLIGPDTLKSSWVNREIEWAIEGSLTVISVCHNGYDIEQSPREDLKKWQAIRVAEETALGYETAIIQLLNSMGYATY